MIHPVICSNKVIVVAEDWPCWLGCLLAVNTPVQAAFITKEMFSVFPSYAHWLSKLSDFEAMSVVPDEWHDYVILGSGSHDFLRLIMPKLRHHAGPFIFANDMVFNGRRQSDLDRLYRSWTTHDTLLGLESVVVRHAEFGGVTSPVDKLTTSYKNILLVTADRYRSKLNVADRSTNAVFSDGASATICQHDPELGIIYENHYTDGSKRNLLFQSADDKENNGFLHMSGAEVWMFTRIKVVPQIMEAVNFCKEKNLKINGIYIHQASRVVVDGIKSLLPKEAAEKTYENYSSYGNTVSSSIPFLLKDFPLNCDGENSVNIFAGFGVGLTSSVIIYGKKNG